MTPTAEWENEYYGAGGGPAGFSITNAGGRPELKPYEGRTLDEIAAAEGKDPRDLVLDIILAGDAGMTVLITSEDDLRLAMQQPWVAFGSDGATVAPDGPLSEGGVHPRGYGTYTKILGEYVRELGLISLEDAIRKATSLPAQLLRIKDRGLLREGYYADIVVFDPQTIIDKATFEQPHQYSEGISYVFVNGQAVLGRREHHRCALGDGRPGPRLPSAVALAERVPNTAERLSISGAKSRSTSVARSGRSTTHSSGALNVHQEGDELGRGDHVGKGRCGSRSARCARRSESSQRSRRWRSS